MADQVQGLDQWKAEGGNGASAKAIAAHLAGFGRQDGSYPHDGADFARCERLLDCAPTLRDRIGDMAEVNAYWAALAPRWADIRESEDKTTLIQSIVGPIEEADPSHVKLGNNCSMRIGATTFKGRDLYAQFRSEGINFHELAKGAQILIRDQKASTSYVQRSLAIGYNRAARLIEALEALGIVTSADHAGRREIVATEVPARLLELAAIHAEATTSTHMRETEADKAVREEAENAAYRANAGELRQFVERFERLDEEKKAIAEQQKEVMAEAKGRGYDTKVLRKLIALRKRDENDIAEEEAVLTLYKECLGMG